MRFFAPPIYDAIKFGFKDRRVAFEEGREVVTQQKPYFHLIQTTKQPQ
jgi:hypothetical protein